MIFFFENIDFFIYFLFYFLLFHFISFLFYFRFFEKSVSYQKKDVHGQARPSFFWYDTDSGH